MTVPGSTPGTKDLLVGAAPSGHRLLLPTGISKMLQSIWSVFHKCPNWPAGIPQELKPLNSASPFGTTEAAPFRETIEETRSTWIAPAAAHSPPAVIPISHLLPREQIESHTEDWADRFLLNLIAPPRLRAVAGAPM